MKPDILFVWIPKNAGSSIEWSLGLRRFPEQIDLREFKNEGRVTFCHMPIDMLVSGGYVTQEFVDGAFKFCFIRNPYDRAVSLFEYSKAVGVIGEHMPFKRVLKRIREKGIASPGLYRSRGLSQWNPQSRFMGDVIFDFIGRFERLVEDFIDLCLILNIGPRDLAHRNETERNYKSYHKYYDWETRTLVEEIYCEDLIRFDYKF